MKLTCIAVDDEPSALEYIAGQLLKNKNVQLLLHTTSPIEAKTYIESNKVDLLITDIEMAELDGISLNQAVKHLCHTIFITAHTALALSAMDKNAIEILNKPCAPEVLKQAINKAVKIIEFDRQQKVNEMLLAKYRVLTETERKIMLEIGKGKNNKDIADRNCISINTMDSHKTNIKHKLGLKSSTELIIFANDLLKIV